MIHTILQPPEWPRPKDYANGIVAARVQMVFTGDVVGWDETAQFSDGIAAQAAQAFANIAAILAEAGARPEHLVWLTWYVTNRAEYLANAVEIGATYRAVFGKAFPAMTVVEVSALMEAAAVIELEETAVIA